MAYKGTMTHDSRARSGMALGGIGAGFFEIRKDGIFHDWNICNNFPLGPGNKFTLEEDSMLFFVVRWCEKGAEPKMKILQIEDGCHVGGIMLSQYAFPWMTGVDRIDFKAIFPFAELVFTDPEMPFYIKLNAWSPFVPHDIISSSCPVAYFDFEVRSRTAKQVDFMIIMSGRNAAGYDTVEKVYTSQIGSGKGYKSIELSVDGLDPAAASSGSQCLVSLSDNSTYYSGWAHRHPYYEKVLRALELPNFDDTDGRNSLNKETGKRKGDSHHFGSIAYSKTFKKRGETLNHSFAYTWNYPNLYNRTNKVLLGNNYATRFKTASDVALWAVKNREELKTKTKNFVLDFSSSDLPEFVLDQANSHLNTFFTNSWYTKDGYFGISEGISPFMDGTLSTVDVSIYGSLPVLMLFPELDSRVIRSYVKLQQPNGEVAHSIPRTFESYESGEGVTRRLDLPSQFVILGLRNCFATNDKTFLKQIWPNIKSALEYVLSERDMNHDLLPDMEGTMCSYDNFPMYGAASYVASQWLSALAHAVEAARIMEDKIAEKRYSEILEKASKTFEEKLWSGSYYRLYNDKGGKKGDVDNGCMADQAIGEWAGKFSGLSNVLNSAHVKTALKTIWSKNMHHFYGLYNCRWPGDKFLHEVSENVWWDQANTNWSGTELAFASFLIYEGFVKEGLEIVKIVDQRYRRNGLYFDHQEWGGHYYRGMASWTVLHALLGLSVKNGEYKFNPKIKASKLFFTFASGTAFFKQAAISSKETTSVEVRTGVWKVSKLTIAKKKALNFISIKLDGKPIAKESFGTKYEKDNLVLSFNDQIAVHAGSILKIEMKQ